MNKKGFTLIEIVLAISFLLIVTVMVVPNMYTMIEKNNQKQLANIESLIIEAAKKYINLDPKTAEYIKTIPPTEIPFYISINDLKRMDLVSTQLKDPTQGNQDYDYTKVVEIKYLNQEYLYELKNRSELLGPSNEDWASERTLITKAFVSVYNNVWYSGLNWEIYKISSTVDGEASTPVGTSDYIHLKLKDTTIDSTTINCLAIENNLNNKKSMLVKRGTSYCTEVVGVGSTIVLKNNMLFIKGNGEAVNPFLLIGDFKGYPNQRLAQRNIGEYVSYNSNLLRIMQLNASQVVFSNNTSVSLSTKIVSGSGSVSDPYQIVEE